MKTNVYHITYTPATKSASLRFWGCNMNCLGCLCQEGLYDHLLKENRLCDEQNPDRQAKPDGVLDFDEVIERLSGLELKRIFLTGEEASIDPNYATLTRAFHENFNSENILYTNGFQMPPLTNTDAVEIGIKAISGELHLRYTGRPVQPVLDNFIKYAKMGMKMTAATILIPGLIEAEEIEKIARFIASVDKNIPYFVLPYFPAGDNPWRKTRPEEVDEVITIVNKHLNNVFGCEGTEREILYDVERVY
jgi:pyruvate-formate lyase-activating enzyme